MTLSHLVLHLLWLISFHQQKFLAALVMYWLNLMIGFDLDQMFSFYLILDLFDFNSYLQDQASFIHVN